MAASPSPEKYLIPIISLSFASLLGLTATSYFLFSTSTNPNPYPNSSFLHQGPTALPSFAYYISGSRGESAHILRLLLAIYHPRYRYLLHLSHDATDKERGWLASAAASVPVEMEYGNVDVVGKGDAMTKSGSSELVATLRVATEMLRMDKVGIGSSC